MNNPMIDMFRKQQVLEQQMSVWRQVVLTHNPALNADYVRTVCEEIVRRAALISTTAPLRHEEVAKFLLERSLAWVMAGAPVQSIGGRLPKTLGDLGMLRIAEGAALTDTEIAAIRNVKRPVLH
jgi:hypothetical protein